jgi:hydrogenase-1 operon protein HyaF
VLGQTDGAPIETLEALLGGAGALPTLRSLDEGPGSAEAGAVLESLLEGLRRYRGERPPVVMPLDALPPETQQLLAESLGEGEVLFTVTGTHLFQIRETALPGVWRVQDFEGGAPRGELLEVADVPSVVRAANAQATCGELSIGPAPVGAMNVLPVLAELRHRMNAWHAGEPNHVINFSLLPMSGVDMRALEAQLGHGPVRAETRGYGSCKVELTGHRNLWSVQFFNNGGALLLDTIEVGDVPAAVAATPEDLQESAARLAELLGR